MAIGFRSDEDDEELAIGDVEITENILRIFECTIEDMTEAFLQVESAIRLNMYAELVNTTDEKGLDIIRVTIYEDDPCSQLKMK
jgi:hypothetical protein